MMTSRPQSLSYSFQAARHFPLVTAAAFDVSPETLGDRFPAFASNAAVLIVPQFLLRFVNL